MILLVSYCVVLRHCITSSATLTPKEEILQYFQLSITWSLGGEGNSHLSLKYPLLGQTLGYICGHDSFFFLLVRL